MDLNLIINFDFLGYSFLFLSGLYFILIIAVYIGLLLLKRPEGDLTESVSIVIAARNEEKRIIPCLQSLENLDYPKDKFEIVFVDDRSSDKTGEILSEYCSKYKNWRLISIDNQGDELKGKKNALHQGIVHSKGRIIFTTDADCIVPASWIKYMLRHFFPDVSMVIGYSPLVHGSGLLYKFLQFDNLFSGITAAAPTMLGFPNNSAGRNLAYRREAYNNTGGYRALKKFKSGDDVHLTERFRYLRTGKIDACIHPESFVQTQLPETKYQFFQQQIRKNSKILKKSWVSILLSIILFLYYIIIICIPIFISEWRIFWLGIMVTKLLLEFVCLLKAAKIFEQRLSIPIIPVMQVVYPFFIMFFSLLGMFQKYSWKK